jgi:hypothetical protein
MEVRMNDPLHIPRPVGPPQPIGNSATHASPPLRPTVPSNLPPKITPPPTLGKPRDDLSSLAVVDEGPSQVTGSSKIQAFGVKEIAPEREFKRNANLTGTGAVHVKSFHGHLHDEGLARLDNRINEWMEAHPQFEIKFATTTIGVWDGKTKDQVMIINIWY